MARNSWTEAEEEIIRQAWENKMTDKETQDLLPNRTVQSVHIHRAHAMGLQRYSLKRFTVEENQYIRDAYLANVPLAEMAAHLHRTIGVISQKIFQFRLKRDVRKTHLAKRYGIDILKISDDPAAIRAALADAAAKERLQLKAEHLAKVELALDTMIAALSENGAGEARQVTLRSARLAGATLEQIAQRLGLTRERVRQITHNIKTPRYLGRRGGAKRSARTVICVRCSNPFTVEQAGRFKYCTACHPIRMAEYKAEVMARSKKAYRENPERYKAYQKEAYAKRQEALNLVRALEASPDSAKLIDEVRRKLHGTEDGSNGTP